MLAGRKRNSFLLVGGTKKEGGHFGKFYCEIEGK